jgi:AcrR family transcriptional regulator
MTDSAKLPAARLVEAAIEALARTGPSAVQARKLGERIGTSTMAVYTYFGGMPGLWEAVVREGFARLATHVRGVEETDNPMADFFTQGLAYRHWAITNPQLYRLMFGLSDAAVTKRLEQDMTIARTISVTAEGQDAFGVMVGSLVRVVAAGQIREVDPVMAAAQFLSATHGYVLLEIAGYFSEEGVGVAWVLGPLGFSLMVGLGAPPDEVNRAGVRALSALGLEGSARR